MDLNHLLHFIQKVIPDTCTPFIGLNGFCRISLSYHFFEYLKNNYSIIQFFFHLVSDLIFDSIRDEPAYNRIIGEMKALIEEMLGRVRQMEETHARAQQEGNSRSFSAFSIVNSVNVYNNKRFPIQCIFIY